MILFAVNVHTGGGKVLLDELFLNQPFGHVTHAFLDQRYDRSSVGPKVVVHSYAPTIGARLRAQWDLFRLSRSLKESHEILLFGNLPPMMPLKGKSIVYLQNGFLLPKVPLPRDSWRLKLRLILERGLLFLFRPFMQELWVQTDWMVQSAKASFNNLTVLKRPFLPSLPSPVAQKKLYDLIHVSSRASHKNFDTFLAAMDLLDQRLSQKISVLVILDGPNGLVSTQTGTYKNLHFELKVGVPRNDLFQLYQKSRIAVVTSSIESFCLPLHEALHFGLKTVALKAPYIEGVPVDYVYKDNSPDLLAKRILEAL